ncbi:MAG: hypothetical protein HRU13_10905 [Phycisphaerales bacterium]|nr:hypothetical protein [Phycisphaerales bacterium]
MIEQGKVSAFYKQESTRRAWALYVAAECSRLSVPHVQPVQSEYSSPLTEQYTNINGIQPSLQSIGYRGASTLASGITLAIAPPTQLMWRSKPKPEIDAELRQNPDRWQQAMAELAAQDILAHAYLDSTSMATDTRSYSADFRSRLFTACLQLVVTGDVLLHIDDDLALTVYRRDRYVTVRDEQGRVVAHGIKTFVDPLTLDDAELAQIRKRRVDLERQDYKARLCEKYTAVAWEHDKKRWKIWHEIDGQVLGDSVTYEKVSPYIAVPLYLNGEDDYGHGIIETNLADLTALESMERSRLDILASASRLLIGVDTGCQVDLDQIVETPNGGFIPDVRVEGGQIQDIAALDIASFRDFQMLTEGVRDKREDLGQDLMIESASQPTGDRVTATQINRIAREIEGRHGPILIPMTAALLRNLSAKVNQILHKRNKMSVLGDMIVPYANQEPVPITGIERLYQDQQLQRLSQFVQTISLLGPEAVQRLDIQSVIESFKDLFALNNMPTLTRSEEDLQQQRREQVADQAEADIAVQTAAQQGV